jgi:hypothetical protein
MSQFPWLCLVLGVTGMFRVNQFEAYAKSHIVILSEAKDLIFTCIYEILRLLRSLRMTGEGPFAEFPTLLHSVDYIVFIKIVSTMT